MLQGLCFFLYICSRCLSYSPGFPNPVTPSFHTTVLHRGYIINCFNERTLCTVTMRKSEFIERTQKEKLQAEFINRHFYLKQENDKVASNNIVVHMPITGIC